MACPINAGKKEVLCDHLSGLLNNRVLSPLPLWIRETSVSKPMTTVSAFTIALSSVSYDLSSLCVPGDGRHHSINKTSNIFGTDSHSPVID